MNAHTFSSEPGGISIAASRPANAPSVLGLSAFNAVQGLMQQTCVGGPVSSPKAFRNAWDVPDTP